MAQISQQSPSIFQAIANGRLSGVDQVLRDNPAAAAERTVPDERTALHVAADCDRMDIVQRLLEAGADFYARDIYGQLPLDVPPARRMTEAHRFLRSLNTQRNQFLQACFQGDVEKVREMLRADATLIQSRDIEEGTPPLVFAACKENPETIDLLIQAGADPNEREWSTSWNPLYFCAENGHLGNLQTLLEAGADLHATWPVEYGRARMEVNALHVAAWKGHPETVRLLLQRGLPVDCHARHYTLFTPLHFAATEGHLPVVRVLVENGANPEMRDGRRNITAVEMAQNAGHTAVRDYLTGR